MKKVKYFYNTHTLRYEKLETPLRVKLLRVFGFIAAALVSSVIIVLIGQRYFPSNSERNLKDENTQLNYQLKILQQQLVEIDQRLDAVEKHDNTVYRNIFEAAPLPDSARVKGVERIAELTKVSRMNENQLVQSISTSMQTLYNRLDNQTKSFDDIEKMVANKALLLAAIPAIQPVSNKDLTRIASGFGYRTDPIYKVTKMHSGLDFTAPQGTPIYATADGTVESADIGSTGFGNHVVIDHGYGYETLYGHMVRIKAHAGQKVKRGEMIGWVGSTGKSTGPHCHYEVHKNGTPVDPIYYFYNDITPEQFDRLLKLAATSTQSFD
ncbi:MAG: peptidoglycan DD-metalloendopeptidase family protein [Chitinophagaceae bacterium]